MGFNRQPLSKRLIARAAIAPLLGLCAAFFPGRALATVVLIDDVSSNSITAE
jgi:hypothetical protein